MKKKLLLLAIIATLLGTSFFNLSVVIGIKSFYMIIQPRKIATPSTYRYVFTIEKKLEVHDWIRLGFPRGTIIDPPIPTDPHERETRLKQIIESMSIGLSPCSACQGLPIIQYYPDGSMETLQFNTHIALDPLVEGYSIITITVPDVCGFVTPASKGTYDYKIATKAEPTTVTTKFELVESQIGVPTGVPEVIVDQPIPASPSQYTIGFNVGLGGWLKQDSGLIKIRFPEGTKMDKTPSDIKPSWITINGKPLSTSPNGVGTNLNFRTPVEINDSDRVTVVFDVRCGITNPIKAGKYQLEVGTTGDPWTKSNMYEITKSAALLKIKPNKVNQKADYTIIYTQNSPLVAGDPIQFILPDNFMLTNPKVTMNEKEISSVEINKSVVTIKIVQDLKIDDAVEVIFKELQNPTKPTFIKIGIQPKGYKDPVWTIPAEIVVQTLEIRDVIINPPNAKQEASYTIRLIFGDSLIPKAKEPISVKFSFLDKPMEVFSSDNLTQEYDLVLTQINPEAGNYSVSVSTPEEPVGFSYDFTINPPLPESKIVITGGKKGNLDWWVELPLIDFTCSDPTAEIFLFWESRKDQIIKYGGTAKPPDPGQYKDRLHWYAKTPYGQEKEQMVEIWVDTLPPEIEIINPKDAKTLVRVADFLVMGRGTKTKTILYGVDTLDFDKIVTINGTKVDVDPTSGNFSLAIILTEGDNKIQIHSEDEAGNSTDREYLVTFDSTPPVIEINPHDVLSKTITGKTDPTAELFINGELIFVESDGSFTWDCGLPGFKELTIQATDPAGNKSEKKESFWYGYTIILQIGNKKGTTNGVEKQIPLSPFIQKGKTLVPFRFVGQELQAKIGFTQDPKTKLVKTVTYELGSTKILLTIGSMKALVNGSVVVLDVPAQIINGTTVVPLRFVSENLGCSLAWDAKTQTITITYSGS
jgi:hypothetical protein